MKAEEEYKTVRWGVNNQMSHKYRVPTLEYTTKNLTKKMDGKWIKIGEVCVDSGRLKIQDPCYKSLTEEEEDGIIWDSKLANMIQYHFPLGCPGLGVSFNTGLGDGCYKVEGLIKTVKGWGLRIVEIRIRFI